MAAVGFELRIAQADDGIARIAQKQELVALDARRAEEEIAGLDLRQADARASVVRLADDQRSVDERLAAAQRRLFEAREDARVRSDRVRDAMTEHARLLERAAALALDAARAEEAQREIEARFSARDDEQRQIAAERARLEQSAADARRALDTEVQALDRARELVRLVDDAINELRAESDADRDGHPRGQAGARRDPRGPRRGRGLPGQGVERPVASRGHLPRHAVVRARRGHRRSRADGARRRRQPRLAHHLRRGARRGRRGHRGRAPQRGRSPTRRAAAGGSGAGQGGHSGRSHRGAEAQDRAPGPGQHDGHRAVSTNSTSATPS